MFFVKTIKIKCYFELYKMSKTQMNYKKVKNTIHHCLDVLNNQYNEINGENEKYNPFNISKFQNYNPCLDLFFEMNVNNLANGTYFVTLKSNTVILTRKISVMK